eukprot:s6815_g5.t3
MLDGAHVAQTTASETRGCEQVLGGASHLSCTGPSLRRYAPWRLAPTFTVGSIIYEQMRLLLGLGYMT